MRKARIVEKDHGDYVKAERDILTSVLHPYIVTLRYSFQVRGRTVWGSTSCPRYCVVVRASCTFASCMTNWWSFSMSSAWALTPTMRLYPQQLSLPMQPPEALLVLGV